MFLATNAFNIWIQLLAVFGGLGIFLYGINSMSDSLKAFAGNKMKVIIEKTTNTPFKGILVGAGVTALIQSSSGTTALTVGLVRAGLMSFTQAIGVIMGANIGTTVTSFLIGLNISTYSLLFVGLGSMVIFFSKKKKLKELGGIILGFGLLFFGLDLMGEALKTILKEYEGPATKMFTVLGKYPILGLLVGTLLTAVIQSSSASIGILQALYVTGGIGLTGALPILLGANIGTTITAIFASIGATVPAKRTAVVHILFNIIGALLFMLLLRIAYVPLVSFIETKWLIPLYGTNTPAMTIGIAHIIFNVISTFVLFFFIKQLSYFACKLVPGTEQTDALSEELSDFSLIEKSPTLALEFVKKAIRRMGDLTVEYYELTKKYTFEHTSNTTDLAEEYERNINSLDKKIHDYLFKFTTMDLDNSYSNILSKHLDTIKDLERIGDHCTNLVGFFNERYEAKETFSFEGSEDIKEMYEAIDKMIEGSIKAYSTFDKKMAQPVAVLEDKVDKMEEMFRKKHVIRINNGTCGFTNADYFVDILSNLERIADHANNIASNIINDEYCQFDEFDH